MRREGKIGEKYTSRTRHTGKCKTPRCRGCHTAPVNKSMGKSKGELKQKQSDINSNYLMHDWRVCETAKAFSHAEGRHRPKVKVGSPSSVWTAALKYYEDSLDLLETPDVCEESLDVAECLDDVYHSDVETEPSWGGAAVTFGHAAVTFGRKRSALKNKISASAAKGLHWEELVLPEFVDGESSLQATSGSDSEPVPETLCFGTVGAVNVGGYWQQHLYSRGDMALADEWPHVGSCPGNQVSMNVSASVPIGRRSLPVSEESGDESDGDYFMAALSEVEAHQGARTTGFGSFVASILGRGRNNAAGSNKARNHPVLDAMVHSDADVHVQATLSDSEESWDGVDVGDADDFEWDLMDMEDDHGPEKKENSCRAFSA